MANDGSNNPDGHLPTLQPGVAGAHTRFGQPGGPDPQEARAKQVNPSSVRAQVRRIAALTRTEFKQAYDSNAATMAMIVAASKYQKAVKGDVKAMQQIEDSVDGKLADRKIEAQVTLADLVNGSFEQDVDADSSDQESSP